MQLVYAMKELDWWPCVSNLKNTSVVGLYGNRLNKKIPLCTQTYIHTEKGKQLSRDMLISTMWHFDKCRLRRASAAHFLCLVTPNDVLSVA